MMVSAIPSVLAAIAIPKFGGLILKAKEAAYKAKIGTVRSALSIYYADNEGILPSGFRNGTFSPEVPVNALESKYLTKFPAEVVPRHHPNGFVGFYFIQYLPWDGYIDLGYVWMYPEPIWPGSTGKFRSMCTHRDLSGRIWSDY
jgi:hypothetical protein